MFSRIATFTGPTQRGYLIGAMQSRLNQLTNEVSTGQKTNPAGSMGNGASLLYQLQAQSDRQDALQTSITTAAQRLDTVQTALTSLAGITATVTNTVQSWTSAMNQGMSVVASQARSTMNTSINLLNTSFAGGAVFGGTAGDTAPMRAADASGGLLDVAAGALDAAVQAKGAPLTKSDIDALINGTDGLASTFTDANSDAAANYAGAAYVGSTDGKPTSVILGASQTVQYDASASQPAFRQLMQGLSMLSLLDAPSTQLDDGAKKELLTQAGAVMMKAENALTVMQGALGAIQARLGDAADAQRSAAAATQTQILSYVESDSYGNSTKISMLQTQLQATYQLTSQISQLSLVRYMPSVG